MEGKDEKDKEEGEEEALAEEPDTPPPPEEPVTPPPPEEPVTPPPPEEPDTPPPPEEPDTPPPLEEPDAPPPLKEPDTPPPLKEPDTPPPLEEPDTTPPLKEPSSIKESPEPVAEVSSQAILQQSQIRTDRNSSTKAELGITGDGGTTGGFKASVISKNDLENTQEKGVSRRSRLPGEGGGIVIPGFGNFSCAAFLGKRSPFIHNPPQPEERRTRVQNPRTPREYIINLREDLADFQETHGLPRTRDYSFLSLGLALAQETARAVCSLVLMFVELFPIVAIVSLIMRFALDKLIEILETDEPVNKLKKSVIFALQMLVIVIPLWILIGTIIIPLMSVIFSIFKRMVQFKRAGRRCSAKPKGKTKAKPCPNSSSFDMLKFFY